MPDHQTTIIAVVTGDQHDTDPVLRRAADLGREQGARVVLYDIGATGSFLESPTPTEFAAEGPDRGVPTMLDPDDLEAAGQAPLASRVRALREEGVDAYGWLPENDDADDLAEYARSHDASVILASDAVDPTPEDLAEAGLRSVERVAR
jgi:hypothetical protein